MNGFVPAPPHAGPDLIEIDLDLVGLLDRSVAAAAAAVVVVVVLSFATDAGGGEGGMCVFDGT